MRIRVRSTVKEYIRKSHVRYRTWRIWYVEVLFFFFSHPRFTAFTFSRRTFLSVTLLILLWSFVPETSYNIASLNILVSSVCARRRSHHTCRIGIRNRTFKIGCFSSSRSTGPFWSIRLPKHVDIRTSFILKTKHVDHQYHTEVQSFYILCVMCGFVRVLYIYSGRSYDMLSEHDFSFIA